MCRSWTCCLSHENLDVDCLVELAPKTSESLFYLRGKSAMSRGLGWARAERTDRSCVVFTQSSHPAGGVGKEKVLPCLWCFPYEVGYSF